MVTSFNAWLPDMTTLSQPGWYIGRNVRRAAPAFCPLRPPGTPGVDLRGSGAPALGGAFRALLPRRSQVRRELEDQLAQAGGKVYLLPRARYREGDPTVSLVCDQDGGGGEGRVRVGGVGREGLRYTAGGSRLPRDQALRRAREGSRRHSRAPRSPEGVRSRPRPGGGGLGAPNRRRRKHGRDPPLPLRLPLRA